MPLYRKVVFFKSFETMDYWKKKMRKTLFFKLLKNAYLQQIELSPPEKFETTI